MAIPTSRIELAEYCLRSLGAPVIEINIDDEQIEDRIDEAIQFFQEYHSDAVVRTFLRHQVTQAELDSHQISLPNSVLSVSKMLRISQGHDFDIFDAKYQMFLNDLAGLRNGTGGLINYSMNQDYLGLIDDLIGGKTQQVTYARHKNTLEILTDWRDHIKAGGYVIIECYTAVDPESYVDVYNDMALKKYLTLLIKKQWGQNLIKFEGMQLPGGVTLNGRAIYDDAVTDIKEMEEQWESKYSAPIDFYIG